MANDDRIKNKFKKKRKSKSALLQILSFLTILTLADTFCFGILFERGGSGLYWAVIFGALVGFVTNIASYLCADWGIGHFFEIPKISLPETKRDRQVAFTTFMISLVAIVLLQTAFAVLRYQQIEMNTNTYEATLKIWDKINIQTLSSNELQKHRNSKPVYANGESTQFTDWATLIIPILTSVMSFIIGLKYRKKYNKFEEQYKKVCSEIEDIREEFECEEKLLKEAYSEKAEKLARDANEALKKAKESLDVNRTEIHDLIGQIEATGEITGFKEALENKVFDDIVTLEYECKKELESLLKKKLPDHYKSHIKELYSTLKKVGSEIKANLSRKVPNPKIFDSHTLENNFSDRLINISKCDENIFKE